MGWHTKSPLVLPGYLTYTGGLTLEKPTVEIARCDGNAFGVIGAVMKALERGGYSQQHITEVETQMTTGDYDHLLQVAMEHVEFV